MSDYEVLLDWKIVAAAAEKEEGLSVSWVLFARYFEDPGNREHRFEL